MNFEIPVVIQYRQIYIPAEILRLIAILIRIPRDYLSFTLTCKLFAQECKKISPIKKFHYLKSRNNSHKRTLNYSSYLPSGVNHLFEIHSRPDSTNNQKKIIDVSKYDMGALEYSFTHRSNSDALPDYEFSLLGSGSSKGIRNDEFLYIDIKDKRFYQIQNYANYYETNKYLVSFWNWIPSSRLSMKNIYHIRTRFSDTKTIDVIIPHIIGERGIIKIRTEICEMCNSDHPTCRKCKQYQFGADALPRFCIRVRNNKK